MKPHSIVLDDGSKIAADILLYGMGRKSAYLLFSKKKAYLLGLPHSPDEDTLEISSFGTSRAVAGLPVLTITTPHEKSGGATTTVRLYSCIAPREDSLVVMLGRALLSNSFPMADARALGYNFDGNVKMPSLGQAQREVLYMKNFSGRRYPSHEAAGTTCSFSLLGIRTSY